jgi:hypothetical protein
MDAHVNIAVRNCSMAIVSERRIQQMLGRRVLLIVVGRITLVARLGPSGTFEDERARIQPDRPLLNACVSALQKRGR